MYNEELKLSNQLCFSVYNLNRRLNKFYEKELKNYELTFSQYLVLLALWEESPQTVKSLGEKLDLSSNTLTPLLKRLEVAGWIQRIKNKKFLEIHLTDKAKRHEKEICDKLENSVQSIMDVQEYQRVRNELTKIEHTLKNEFDL